jgi:hypothetical protein
VFDDSFEHEVFQRAESPRLVLIVDMWHYEMGPREVAEFMSSWIINDSDRAAVQAMARGAVPVMRQAAPGDPHALAPKVMLEEMPPWIRAIEPEAPPRGWKRKRKRGEAARKGKKPPSDKDEL